ncbi:uncharacterized protein LOC130367935 isoform X2 [Hyla sarda]|uniref:uncharacterized protein LOC130367935 isoform X2 n=1 Tax=Hyla sarda TaxID=327740 RepID=UPI0024C2673F|nr:uncharacterized protein LOC130367935 isoform X2 [Hyla sarda]XP_056426939.1 uncharacterized protein LOC130367935 isoform X2 [Hyla sarda]XP_056426940.1 uncharacterized protein LOC130367935 isoform X2 [Hyla sarda]XP_056426941.1 uncharacterized protein LOC130367935 isoform X2 [Hyla sarda]XP_056426942.1 uncharacterized protein LOC130367935 isoform X2 [Hyla sarda]XP_056426943.1 uncharacterized protein LOC130367935 isoform X2 [Hyla sarda]XP_056426944.1 uncharacterized protein LOC130367935 isoform
MQWSRTTSPSILISATEKQGDQVPIRFEDVAVYFSAGEWGTLGIMERLLYMDVMLENYYNLFSMGFVYEKPEIISRIQKCRDRSHTADLEPITVTQEQDYFSGTDVSTRYWRVNGSVFGKQELLLQEQTCNGVEQPICHLEDSTRQDVIDQSCCNGNRPLVQTHSGQSLGKNLIGAERVVVCKSHLTERQYTCTNCGKCFNRSSHLLRHRRIHAVHRIMPSCLVNQCISKTGRKGQSEQIILHPFPKDITRIKEWLQQTGQIFKDVKALAQLILDGNKQNKYRLCSCHFTLDSYIFNKHGRSLKVDAVPSIFPVVKEGECIIAENLKKNRIKRVRKRLDAAGLTNPRNERFLGKDDQLLDKNGQNQYGLCPCHFARDQYIINSHGRPLEVNTVSSIIPVVKEEECFIRENIIKNCLEKMKSPYGMAALTTLSNGGLTAEEEEALRGIQWRKIGFCSMGTQTDHTISNSVLVFQRKQTVGSGDLDRPCAPDAAVAESLGLISKLKVEMESLLEEVPIRFEDVAVYFSAGEWGTLGIMERLLYMDVMLENYYNLFSMGFIYEKPEIISRMEKGLDLCHTEEIVYRTEKHEEHCHTAGLQPITVKQEPEPDVSTRYWTVESSVCGEQELLLQDQMCNGDEQPVYRSEDFTKQNYYNGNKSLVQTHSGQSHGKTWTGSELTADCKSHLTERHYTCTDCGRCFNRSSNLIRHKRIHAVERPYFCGKCGTLIDNSLLLIHRKTYNGKKPYICSNCGSYVVCTL